MSTPLSPPDVQHLRYQDHREKTRRNIRCEAACTDPTSHGKPCPRLALYRIDGTALCRRHAGAVLLDLMARPEAAE